MTCRAVRWFWALLGLISLTSWTLTAVDAQQAGPNSSRLLDKPQTSRVRDPLTSRADGSVATSFSEIRAIGPQVVIDECTKVLVSNEVPPAMRTRWYETRGDAHFVAKNMTAALDDYNQALAIDTNCPTVRWKRVRALGSLQQTDELAKELDALLKAYPDSSQANVGMAMLQLQQGNLDAANALLDKALALDPNSSRAHYIRAGVFREQKRYKESVEATEKSILLDPYPDVNVEERFLNCAECYCFLQNYEKTLAYAELTYRVNPKSFDAAKSLFDAHFRMGELRAARVYATAMEQLRPDDLYTHIALWKLSMSASDWPKAISEAERTLAQNANNSFCIAALGEAYLGANDFAKAFDCYDHALQINPHDSQALLSKSSALCLCPDRRWRDAKQALALIDRLEKEYDADGYTVNYLRSIAWAELGDYVKARDFIEKALHECAPRNSMYEIMQAAESLINRKIPMTEDEIKKEFVRRLNIH
jgi:tetratricopeptide (TPR) repeat protein